MMTATAAVNGTDSIVKDREEAAAGIIVSAMKWSAAAALVPVPVLDLAALGAVQARMVIDLSELYEEQVTSQSARAVVSVLLGSLLPGAAAGAVGASLIKSAPLVGAVAGAGALAGFGAAATYAIGKVFVNHFKGGGTFSTLDGNALKAELAAEFRKGKSATAGA